MTKYRTSFSSSAWVAVAAWALLLAPWAAAQSLGPAVFVGNNGNLEGSTTAFRVNPDGTLTFVNRVITGTRPSTQFPCPGCNPYEIAISPSGKYLATGHASGTNVPEQISIFQVAPDASITQIGAFSVPGTPMDVVWITDQYLATVRTDPSPNLVVVYRFDPSPPSLTQVDAETTGTFSTYLAIDPSRTHLYVNDSGSGRLIRNFKIDSGGNLTLVSTASTGSYYGLELAVSNDGTKLYGAGGITNVIVGYDVGAEGVLTPMAGWPFPQFGSSPSNVAFSTDDKYLLVGHGTDATVRSASIDPSTGMLTYTGNMFDVGLQGTLGDVQSLAGWFFVTDNSTAIDGIMGIYSFTLNPDGSFTQNGPIVSTQGIAPRSVATWGLPLYRGDMNCDNVVDFDDIDAFVLALSGPEAYAQSYPNCQFLRADCNQDSVVNFDDIDPFVACLTGACP